MGYSFNASLMAFTVWFVNQAKLFYPAYSIQQHKIALKRCYTVFSHPSVSLMLSSAIPFHSVSITPKPGQASDAEHKHATHKTDQELTTEEEKIVAQMKARDSEVKTHEQAHINAAAGLSVSGPSYTYATGPDGTKYAIGGEVNIDVSPVEGDPEATVRKAEQIRRAALAPAQPSSQDHKVAAGATTMATKARAELFAQNSSGSEPENHVDFLA